MNAEKYEALIKERFEGDLETLRKYRQILAEMREVVNSHGEKTIDHRYYHEASWSVQKKLEEKSKSVASEEFPSLTEEDIDNSIKKVLETTRWKQSET